MAALASPTALPTAATPDNLAPVAPVEPEEPEDWETPRGIQLDPDALASIGMAAHRAGLEALESLADPRSKSKESAILGQAKSDGRAARATRPSKAEPKAQRKQPRPAQDEWGMFDPTQCGPDALFDEDEWTDEDEDEKRPIPRARAY